MTIGITRRDGRERLPRASLSESRGVDHEPVRQVARFLLVRHHRHVARVRTSDDAGEPVGLFGQEVRRARRCPTTGCCSSTSAGHIRRSRGRNDAVIDSGSDALDLEQDHDPRLVERREHDLAHRERRVRVDQRRRFGTDGNRREGRRDRCRAGSLRDGKTAITRRRSRADRSTLRRHDLRTEERGAATDDVEERAGVRRALQLQTAGFNTESREVWSGCLGT